MAIQKSYDDGKKHIHVLSFGAGTQSTALLLMALKGEVNGVIPDYIIFSDTGWEPDAVYKWLEKIHNHVLFKYNRAILYAKTGNIREDTLRAAATGMRAASLPFFTLSNVPIYDEVSATKNEYDENQAGFELDIEETEKTEPVIIGYKKQQGMVMRQCTQEYKISPVNRKVRELLGYDNRQRVKEIVHVWKGISTDEIQRVKPSQTAYQVMEHPLIDILNMDRQDCISYVEREGLGTPPKSSCVGCPYHDNNAWLEIKRNDPKAWGEAIEFDKAIRNMPRLKAQAFLHRSMKPLDEVDLGENQAEIDFDGFGNECEGMCGV